MKSSCKLHVALLWTKGYRNVQEDLRIHKTLSISYSL